MKRNPKPSPRARVNDPLPGRNKAEEAAENKNILNDANPNFFNQSKKKIIATPIEPNKTN